MVSLKRLKEVEFWEYHYFKEINFLLSQDIGKMISSLNSKASIKDDWLEAFNGIDKKRQNSDFARGAERVYFWLFNQFGIPNSAPIGADLMFETYNSFVHIDIKTAKYTNKSDYQGKIPIGENQTSYKSNRFNSNLPRYYNENNKNKKFCLTYALNIIYDDRNQNFHILTVLLVCIPNGLLKEIYGNNIIGAGKRKGKSFRYDYKNNPYFQLIDKKPFRIKMLFIDDSINERDVTKLQINT